MHSSGNEITELFLIRMRHRSPQVRVTGLVCTKAVDEIGRVTSALLDAFTVTTGDLKITLDLRGAKTERALLDVGGGLKPCWGIQTAFGDVLTVVEESA